MPIVPGNSERLENSVFAILSSANRENLPVLYPGPCDLLDTTSPTWFKFLTDLSLVIPDDSCEGWVHPWPTYTATFPDQFKERWFLQLRCKARHLFIYINIYHRSVIFVFFVCRSGQTHGIEGII
uniref:Uncharacterized protein n=1 Tax=Brassica campestris TaxID=3711 RepID=A0A3P5Z6I8_BRACM|nr:unnamed protein product [Brassica rapa]